MSDHLKVVPASFGPKACDNLASDLRAMADAVDRGEIVELVAAWTQGGQYQILHSASLIDALTLSTLLHRKAVDKFMGM